MNKVHLWNQHEGTYLTRCKARLQAALPSRMLDTL